MKILLLGGLGYIGTRLSDHLTAANIDYEIADIGLYQNAVMEPKNLSETGYRQILSAYLEPQYISGFDAVVDLAGISNDPVNQVNLEAVYHPTLRSSLRIAQICADHEVRYIFASSCSVYGFTPEVVTENSQCAPLTGYSHNKWEIECGLDLISEQSPHCSFTSLRFGTIFGYSRRMRLDLVLNMFSSMAITSDRLALNSDGLAWRPHLFLDDACRFIIHVLSDERDRSGHFIVNVGALDCNAQIKTVAQKFVELDLAQSLDLLGSDEKSFQSDRKIDKRGRDARSYIVDFSRLRLEFPTFEFTALEDGINSTVSELLRVPRFSSLINQPEFYRLQHCEDLVSKGRICFGYNGVQWR